MDDGRRTTDETRRVVANLFRFHSPLFRRLGYIVWLVMLVMSIFFYQERAFFMDAGFQLFNLINEEAVQVYHYRFVTAIPQIIPWLLVKMEVPLQWVAMSFSASYILFFLFIYHILIRYLKNDFLGWVLTGLFTFISLDTFYHIQSEFYLGLALLLLAFGLALRWGNMGKEERIISQKKWRLPFLIILIAIGFSHKLSLVFFGFLWVFFLLSEKRFHEKWYFILLLIFLIVTGIKSMYFTNWYEAAKQVGFQNNWNKYFPNFHELPSNVVFLKRCMSHYYLLPIFLFISSLFYLWKKQWLKLAMIWLGALGFILLYNISDPAAQFRFYSEVTYLPLIMFAIVPLFFDVLPYFQKIKWLPWALGGIMLLRLTTIAMNHQIFENKMIWIENKLAAEKKKGHHKLLMKSSDAPQDTLLMEWGTPFTAMHLSAIDNPKNAGTILVKPHFKWYEDKMERTDIFFSYFDKILERGDLNEVYYDMGEGRYIFLEK